MLERVVKYSKSNKLGVAYMLLIAIISFATLIAYTSVFEYNALAYIFALFFGILDSGASTHSSMLLGFEFGDKSVIAFGI